MLTVNHRDFAFPASIPPGEFTDVKRVFLIGHPNRGRITGVALVAPDGPREIETTHYSVQSNHVLQLDSELVRALRQSAADMRIFRDGEPFQVLAWIVDRGAYEVELVVADGDCQAKERPRTVPWQAVAWLLDSREIGKRLREHLKQSRDPRAPDQFWFALLDQDTNPSLVEELGGDPGRVERVQQELLAQLPARVYAYQRGLKQPRYPTFKSTDTSYLATAVRSVLKKLRLHLEGRFAKDPPALDNAFEQFAAGRLHVRLEPGFETTQPKSANYFLFGEVALLALDQEPGNAFWLHCARAFIRTQRLYARAYAPGNGNARFRDYDPCKRRDDPSWNDLRKELRSDYASRTEDALRVAAARNCAEAFPGGFGA